MNGNCGKPGGACTVEYGETIQLIILQMCMKYHSGIPSSWKLLSVGGPRIRNIHTLPMNRSWKVEWSIDVGISKPLEVVLPRLRLMPVGAGNQP